MDVLVFTKRQELFLAFIGGYLHIVEVGQQARALQFVLLILQFTFGESDHAPVATFT